MPTYEIIRREWDYESDLDTETSVIVTNEKATAIAAYKNIIQEARNLKETADPDLQYKIERFNRGIQALFYQDTCHHEDADGRFVEDTFIFIHPEENVVYIENKEISFKDRKILSFLGAGVNGFVLKCLDTRLESNLAIKIWLNDKDDKAIFESRKLKQAEHPNVVNIKLSANILGYNYAELGLVEGKTLRKWLQRNPQFHRRIGIAKQIIETLDYVHEQNIYHGDLHEDNIIITPKNKIMILDFGTSKTTGRSYKELSDIRASWILTHTLYALLEPEIEPYLTYLHEHIQYFLKEHSWKKIRGDHKKSPIVFPADYVNASFDILIEFLMAEQHKMNNGRDIYLLSDLGALLMTSPFIKYENFIQALEADCNKHEMDAFISSIYASTHFDGTDGIHNIDETISEMMESTRNEFKKNGGLSNPQRYYELISGTHLGNCKGYRAWRKFHKRVLRNRGINSLTTVGI